MVILDIPAVIETVVYLVLKAGQDGKESHVRLYVDANAADTKPVLALIHFL